ncbi:SapB/AmfS family lanthipeptide [Streptomyces sp. UNOB3_S3]|nr:SapB/AmfS family lanthipeptide [Streptomyces sp. UNOB3_S3]MCC3776128.1 SapB/AmfS family lanthipeptide [Streptomyces sp. UNOB3_S3]
MSLLDLQDLDSEIETTGFDSNYSVFSCHSWLSSLCGC